MQVLVTRVSKPLMPKEFLNALLDVHGIDQNVRIGSDGVHKNGCLLMNGHSSACILLESQGIAVLGGSKWVIDIKIKDN